MKLTGIFLYLDLVEFRSDSALAFRSQTRFLCNYVQRKLVERKVLTDGFKTICVICKNAPAALSYKNSSSALIAEVPFMMADYEKLSEDELPEYFIGLLNLGLLKCSRDQNLPAEYFSEAIQSFRDGHYKNEWQYAEKTFRTVGLKCRLQCKLDLSWFHLILEVERAGQIVFSQEILKTLPDEVIYAHRFKDIKFDGQTVIVQDKFGEPLFEWSSA